MMGPTGFGRTPDDCVLIASGTAFAAEHAARSAGLEPRFVISRRECAGRLDGIRRQARALGIETVAIHSPDWDRQPLPELFELAALRLGLPYCTVLVGDGRVQLPVSRADLTLRAARLPLETTAALARVGVEMSHFARARRRSPVVPALTADRDAVLGIWPGAPGATVGGHVTHMSGVLAAFRRLGFRVGLLTLGEPPQQLAETADEIEVAPALPRAARLTSEVAVVCSNRVVRAAGQRLLRRLRPRLLYQRHEAFVTYGVELAEAAGAPLVLEWNNSEVWAHLHWHAASPVKRVFTPLAATMERYVLQRAQLIAAVSGHAAQMALDGGAAAEAVVVLPNGVDVEAIDRARHAAPPVGSRSGAIVGWVGSFDPWHGADVLLRALSLLPEDVSAVLVGDGAERAACESLARELAVAHRVQWTGSVAHYEAIQRLAECDLLVSPHVPMEGRPFFGSPTKIFEYMAICRPIVASALEQIGELLDHNRTAVLVAPGDADDLAHGIQAVLDLPDRGHQLAIAARCEAEKLHTWDARVRVILARLGSSDGAGGADPGIPFQLSRSE